MEGKRKAVIMMIDNSISSINADFHPTRLQAQKQTVERYAECLLSANSCSEIAVGTLSSIEFGIHVSFTSSISKMTAVVSQISAGGEALLQKGLKTALLALRHCTNEIHCRQIIAFVSSHNDVDSEFLSRFATAIDQANKGPAKVTCGIVLIGPDVPNEAIFGQALRRGAPASKWIRLLPVPHCPTILSDTVLSSFIGPEMSPVDLSEFEQRNPSLAAALELSNSSGQKRVSPSLEMILVPNTGPRARHPRVTTSKKKGEKDQKH